MNCPGAADANVSDAGPLSMPCEHTLHSDPRRLLNMFRCGPSLAVALDTESI